MSKTRFIVFGSAGLAVVAGGLVAVPTTRHMIRHEIAKHRHVRFSDIVAQDVVPVHQEPASVPPREADPRFAPRPASQEAFQPVTPVTLDAAAFGPLTTTSTRLATAEASTRIEKGSVGQSSAATAGEPEFDVDLSGAKQAIRLYRAGDLATADDFARLTSGPLRTLLDWAAIRLASRQAGVARMQAFMEAHPDWPTLPWIQRRIEEAKATTRDSGAVLALFSKTAPETLLGKLGLARARIDSGDREGGAALVRDVWRDEDLSATEEAVILKEFGSLLRREDHKARADRLLYAESVTTGMRAAVLAGPDVVLLEKARAAVAASAPSDAAIAAVPRALQGDPGLLFTRIQKARRAGKIGEAAALMVSAPSDPALLVDGDEWWVERRLIARKLLDQNDPKTAYRICAGAVASSDAARMEAEFHAGWIALRFLNDPALAAPHFAKISAIAEAPISIARGAYWQARAAEATGDGEAATRFYSVAAAQPTTFYGQIAAAALGRPAVGPRPSGPVAAGGARREAIRAVSLLFALGERDLGIGLALSIAKTEPDISQVAALTQVLVATQDARATLTVGKAAAQRGMPLDEAAFPTFGVPGYMPLNNSADRPTVYAIARQESEFDPRSVSSAGAKGLMQLIASTARQTAEKAGIGFDENRLLTDAAFNAQIGAAHLGKLLNDEGGSYILTFAAYNAGARKVQEWIQAYGDPRKPGVDPIDWIERIPYTETRNYVQRVFENMQIYRARFGMPTALLTQPATPQVAGKGT